MAYARWSSGPWYIWDAGSLEDPSLFVGLARGVHAYIDLEEAETMLTSDLWPRWPNISKETREVAEEALREWLRDLREEEGEATFGAP